MLGIGLCSIPSRLGSIPITNENSRFMKAYSVIFESCSVGQSSQYSSIACGWPQSQLPNMTSSCFHKFGNSHSRWVYVTVEPIKFQTPRKPLEGPICGYESGVITTSLSHMTPSYFQKFGNSHSRWVTVHVPGKLGPHWRRSRQRW